MKSEYRNYLPASQPAWLGTGRAGGTGELGVAGGGGIQGAFSHQAAAGTRQPGRQHRQPGQGGGRGASIGGKPGK